MGVGGESVCAGCGSRAELQPGFQAREAGSSEPGLRGRRPGQPFPAQVWREVEGWGVGWGQQSPASADPAGTCLNSAPQPFKPPLKVEVGSPFPEPPPTLSTGYLIYEYFFPGLGPGENCQVNTQWIPLSPFLGKNLWAYVFNRPGPLHLALVSGPCQPHPLQSQAGGPVLQLGAWCLALGGCRAR